MLTCLGMSWYYGLCYEMSNKVDDVTGAEYMPYEPVWFKNEMEPVTGQLSHIYKGGYWDCKEKQDWSICPHIF